ncbi:MAG: hypothetical protein J7499_13080 [Sphingopyxis sp.]|nr:hypothetical protein [Sphingopyxis sp.]
MTSSSTYVRLPNDLLGTPPMEAGKAVMHAFLVKGDRASQQRYCDAALNGFRDARYSFSVLGDNVLVTSIYASEMRSLDPLERRNGSVGEIDIAFWSIVRCTDALKEQQDRYMWLPSFMFVDSGPAMASGREIYGYPKCVSDIVRPADDPRRAEVSVATLHFERFGPDQRASVQPICAIREASGAKAPGTSSGDEQVIAGFGTLLGLEGADGALPFPQLGIPQVMLRQYRDATRAGMAQLKEVILVTPSAGTIGDGGALPAGLEICVHRSASHNIRDTLGLSEVNAVTLGAWLEFDFRVGWATRLLP